MTNLLKCLSERTGSHPTHSQHVKVKRNRETIFPVEKYYLQDSHRSEQWPAVPRCQPFLARAVSSRQPVPGSALLPGHTGAASLWCGLRLYLGLWLWASRDRRLAMEKAWSEPHGNTIRSPELEVSQFWARAQLFKTATRGGCRLNFVCG